MTPTPARWAAGGLLVLTVAALAASAGFGIAAHEWRDAFAFVPVLLAFAGVGAFVASHRPRNAIGWLFLAEGLGAALSLAGLTYAKYAVRSGAPPGASRMAECRSWAPSFTSRRCDGGSFLVPGLPIAFESSRRRCRGLSWCPLRPGSARRP